MQGCGRRFTESTTPASPPLPQVIGVPIATSRIATRWTTQSAAQARFGEVDLDLAQSLWLDEMNKALIELCQEMPASLRDASLLAIQRHLAGFQLRNLLTFFTKFAAPAWTVLYWLEQRGPSLDERDAARLRRGQAMAMFLHILDDHLVDGEIPLDNCTLQLRTQAWMAFAASTQALAAQVPDGPMLRDALLSRYFRGVHAAPPPTNLGDYCAIFRDQLATGLVLSFLMARRNGVDEVSVGGAFEEFGIAWRLLDDLRDLTTDLAAGTKSGVYLSLCPRGRRLWEDCIRLGQASPVWPELAQVLDEGVLDEIVTRVIRHLEKAANLADAAGLVPYGRELRQLAAPLRVPQASPVLTEAIRA